MENKNNSKSARRKLFFTRCGVFAILLLMLLPMLCSAAPPPQTAQVTVTIDNPNNLTQDITIIAGIDETLQFGTNIITGDIFTVVDGFYGDVETNLPTGQYVMIEVYGSQPSGYNCTLIPNGEEYFLDLFAVYLSAFPTLTVVESDVDTTSMFIPFVVPIISHTDSLLNTWTSITNWVISSLNTVQGVFVSRGSGLLVNDYVDMSNTITFDGDIFAYVNYQTFPDGDIYYGDQIVNTEDDGFTIDTVSIDGVEYTVVYMNGVPLQMTNIVTGIFFNTALDLSIGAPAGGYELTLLGTLAVIGVSIGICFLLIGVIQKFLKLRG